MTAESVIAECRRLGVKLTPAGGKLKINAPAGAINPELRAGLAEHKGPILALLVGKAKGYVPEMPAAPNTCVPNAACSASPRSRIGSAARKLGLPVAEVLAQFDSFAYSPAEIAEAAGWSDDVTDWHAGLLAAEFAEDRRRERDAAMMENIAERAGITEADGVARQESEANAVRLVQCRSCRHFTPDRSSPLAGIGACSEGGWPQSDSERPGGPAAPWCELFGEVVMQGIAHAREAIQ